MVAEEERKQRKTAKGNFTRSVNNLNVLLDQGVSQVELVAPQFERMNQCYEILEKRHQEFLNATDIDIEDDPAGFAYMDDCDATHAAAVVKYSSFLKKETADQLLAEQTAKENQEKKEREDRQALEDQTKAAELIKLNEERSKRFDSEKAQLSICIAGFKRMTLTIVDNLTGVSVVDRRREFGKVESEFSSLKNRLVALAGIDPAQDLVELNETFEKDAEEVFLKAQKDILLTLKDQSETSGGASSSSNSSSTIRKEQVTLPTFEGDESKSPFLKFPVWQKQWQVMIADYDASYRDVMLWRHLDDAAQGKIVGYETRYEEAFERLRQFYGDPLKIIQCVMEEVNSPNEISEGDYQSLIDYSVVLEDNFNRLTAMGGEYQKEMSNSVAMDSILRKFPRVVGEQWFDYLAQQDNTRKLNQFPVLIEWLKSRRSTWEGMASVDVQRVKDSAFYVNSSPRRSCFQCGSEDHIQRDCPNKNTAGQKQTPGGKKKRSPPSVKKFWCALHQDDPSRRCFSDSCQELRRLDAAERVQLLQNNGDCFHCCGDHRAMDCTRKERVCGGNKDDRGCRKSHQVHELFCVEARVFAVQHTHSLSSSKDGVLLLIMQVTISRKSAKKGSVFWDLGCTSNFIREEFAKNCGFKGTMENLTVITLGGKVSEYVSVMTYKCSLVTIDGETEFFEAYGMETITGAVTGMQHSKIKQLFPNLSEQNIRLLQRQSEVDILIGAGHVSWHPEKAEKAKGGGDFWIFRGQFGSCLGGRHPEIREMTKKSDNLFVSVQRNFHISTQQTASTSHELEYCPRRCDEYFLQQSTVMNQVKTSASDILLTVGLPPESSETAGDTHLTDDLPSESPKPTGDALMTVNLPPESTKHAGDAHLTDDLPPESSKPTGDGLLTVGLPPESAKPACDTFLTVDLPPDSFKPAVVEVNTAIANSSETLHNDVVNITEVTNGETFNGDQVSADNTEVTEGREQSLNTDSMTLSPTPSTPVSTSGTNPSSGVDETEVCFAVRASPLTDEDLFFKSQAIGTIVQPECGGCKCGTCAIPGMKFSFKEQQEYDVIQRNLVYNEQEKRYYTEYPWMTDRSVLPRNDKEALKLLLNVERVLLKDPARCEGYRQQIQSMVERGAAVELTTEQLNSWEGDYYYLPLLGVLKKGKWRLVFDAARRQCGHPSMNECIMKGPHRFMNDLGAVLIGFRNGRVAAVADLCKFHNQVSLFEKDVHMQRFLWRDMRQEEPPKHMAVTVNNFGVTAANCIATSALHQSADHFSDIYPYESQYIKDQTYIDDELVAADNFDELHTLTDRLDEICDHAGMKNKGWVFSSQEHTDDVVIGKEEGEKVLGLSYCPSSDTFFYKVTLKLKTLTDGEFLVASPEELQSCLSDLVLTRRLLLSNIARIFDPLGLLSPILLQAKILMRESWCTKKTGWDDPLPPDQHQLWIDFLLSLVSLGSVTFARSLWPREEVTGLPTLVIFSDGSVQAFGAAAYIHWTLKSGGHWSRLIMAKSKIAPKNIISVPRMELNGAVIGTRMRNFILKETNLKFGNFVQLVDSSTVLGYIQKECGSFQPFEGVRIAEIQSSMVFPDGRTVTFAWVASQDNPSDWCTKPRSAKDVQNCFWTEGPDFLKRDLSSWPLKYTYKKENLEGQLHLPKQVKCLFIQAHHDDFFGRIIHRSSSWSKSVRVLAWILRFTDSHWLRLLHQQPLNSSELKRARTLLIRYAQRELVVELQCAVDSGKGRYRKLAPILDSQGIWRVGSRMQVVPFTIDAKLPALLPTNHRVTLLIMRSAHNHSHLAQDGTASRFRALGFWTIRCGHLAKSVYEKCMTCKKLNRKTLQQQMGDIPEERLAEPYAWGFCQMDLFGPFSCRSDVNPRSSKKTWGMIIEDVNSGAVHLDVVQDYSAQAVILSLRRFGALRGWPGVISSDPGSQLESAGGKLEEWWSKIGDSILTFAGTKNFEWKISPANSPWRQGKVERKIAIVKRLLTASIGDTRLTPMELQTVLFEIGNICNERPIGSAIPRSDGSYALVTPNQLLLGRSVNILPDDSGITEQLPVSARYRIVHHVTSQFWKRWSEQVSPSLVIRQKWHKKTRNVSVGDLVMVCDRSPLKAKYKIGVVDEVSVSRDGSVRSATIRYAIVKNDHSRLIRISRSVQRLVLLLPIEEQHDQLEVEEDDVRSRVVKAGV